MVSLESLASDIGGALAQEVTVDPKDAGREVGAQLSTTQAPAEMLTAIVRAYAIALQKPDARTLEGRNRILKALRELLDDAIREVRMPESAPTHPPEDSP